MDFETYLQAQLGRYPAMQAQDAVKLCYQAARGAEHLLSDLTAAQRYFDEEFEATPPQVVPLWEPISPQVCRVHLGAWKSAGLPSHWLFRMFAASAKVELEGEDRLESYLEQAGNLHLLGWDDFLTRYREAGMPAVRHSQIYREAYRPAYRIVNVRFARLIPILQRAAEREGGVIAIDGRAASGKTSMAEGLRTVLNGAVVHMDDFFLPSELRTEERLGQPGGNVHYERFAREILPNLTGEQAFSYRRFDCGVMALAGQVTVEDSPWRIVEGSYSHHPALGRYAHISVFSCVEPEEQMRRIVARNGPEMAEIFRSRWIPMEENYFDAFSIAERADIQV